MKIGFVFLFSALHGVLALDITLLVPVTQCHTINDVVTSLYVVSHCVALLIHVDFFRCIFEYT